MHLVTCRSKECTAVATISEHGVDIHSALDAAGCSCCPQDHHHGRAAIETGSPCRPVIITLAGGSAEAA